MTIQTECCAHALRTTCLQNTGRACQACLSTFLMRRHHPAASESLKVTQESRVLDDKLGALKDQISELRSSIKNFETELDARLDACFKSILAKKGAESGVV